jgi:hypothetical protein
MMCPEKPLLSGDISKNSKTASAAWRSVKSVCLFNVPLPRTGLTELPFLNLDRGERDTY